MGKTCLLPPVKDLQATGGGKMNTPPHVPDDDMEPGQSLARVPTAGEERSWGSGQADSLPRSQASAECTLAEMPGVCP